jgi:hypothetical protein
LAREAAARVLDEMAKDLPTILANFIRTDAKEEVRQMQDRIGGLVAALQRVVEETERERPVTFSSTPDPGPLPRTVLRLRHDLVIMGRAGADPLPQVLTEDLRPIVDKIAAAVANYFHACARALNSEQAPPPLAPLQAELDASDTRIAVLRQRDLSHLSGSQLENLFALSFALEQLQRNLVDLERCVRDWATSRQPTAKQAAA